MTSRSPSLPPLEKFTAFPELPIEIRLKIWYQTLPGPRVVRVFYDKDLKECRSPSSIPAAIYVCKESRREALRFYKLSFGPQFSNNDILEPTTTASPPEGRIFFNFEIDTFFAIPWIVNEDDPWGQTDDLTPGQAPVNRILDAAICILEIIEHTTQIHKIRSFAASRFLVGLMCYIASFSYSIRNLAMLKKLGIDCKRYLMAEHGDNHLSAKDKHVINPIDLDDDLEDKDSVSAGGAVSYVDWYDFGLMRVEVEKIQRATGSKWQVAYLSTGLEN